MNYIVLARKWRPKKFTDLIGQQYILKIIENSFLLKRIHHAYLISGIRGVGKTTIARLFIKGLSCIKGISYDPCNQCTHCKEIDKGSFIDFIEIDAASRTKVDDTKELLHDAQYVPSQGRFKLYLIDEVHMLSRSSFNVLLKILEEPPDYVKFFLVTTERQKLPVTILSRCLSLHLKILNIDQIVRKLSFILEQEQIEVDINALRLLASRANGSMRDALSLTDQAIALGLNKIDITSVRNMFGILNVEYPVSIIKGLLNNDIDSIMKIIAQCEILGVDWEDLLVELLSLLQNMAISQFSSVDMTFNNNKNDDLLHDLQNLSKITPPEEIQLYYQILLIGRKELPYAPSYKMGVEMTLLRALAFKPGKF